MHWWENEHSVLATTWEILDDGGYQQVEYQVEYHGQTPSRPDQNIAIAPARESLDNGGDQQVENHIQTPLWTDQTITLATVREPMLRSFF